MAKKVWWDELAIINNTGTSYAAVSSGSPYSPIVDGRLIGVMIVFAGDAATSLMEALSVKLQYPTWGRDMILGGGGGGIRTAPAFPVSNAMYECDLPVEANKNITMQALWNVTAVTPHVLLMGLFESNQ